MADLERVQKENNESLERYKVETVVGITDYLPKLRPNYILHAHVVVGTFDVNRVDFSCLHQYINDNLGFNVMNPSWC